MEYYLDCYHRRSDLANGYKPMVRLWAISEEQLLFTMDAMFKTDRFDYVGLYHIDGHRIHGRWKITPDPETET